MLWLLRAGPLNGGARCRKPWSTGRVIVIRNDWSTGLSVCRRNRMIELERESEKRNVTWKNEGKWKKGKRARDNAAVPPRSSSVGNRVITVYRGSGSRLWGDTARTPTKTGSSSTVWSGRTAAANHSASCSLRRLRPFSFIRYALITILYKYKNIIVIIFYYLFLLRFAYNIFSSCS